MTVVGLRDRTGNMAFQRVVCESAGAFRSEYRVQGSKSSIIAVRSTSAMDVPNRHEWRPHRQYRQRAKWMVRFLNILIVES